MKSFGCWQASETLNESGRLRPVRRLLGTPSRVLFSPWPPKNKSADRVSDDRCETLCDGVAERDFPFGAQIPYWFLYARTIPNQL